MNTFASRSKLRVDGQEYEIYRLNALDQHGCAPHRLPYSLRILLENLLRTENGRSVTADDIRFVAQWQPEAVPDIADPRVFHWLVYQPNRTRETCQGASGNN